MTTEIEILHKNRKAILELIDGFTMDQMNKIPAGFNNNLVWNIAHLIVTQQLLCYKFSELPMKIETSLVEAYVKGTKPSLLVGENEFELIKKLFIDLPEKFEIDYRNNIFKKYLHYTTSLNVELNDIESALAFVNFHEGIHLGVILSIRKLI